MVDRYHSTIGEGNTDTFPESVVLQKEHEFEKYTRLKLRNEPK